MMVSRALLLGHGWPKLGARGDWLLRRLVVYTALAFVASRRMPTLPEGARWTHGVAFTLENRCDPRSGRATR